MKISLVRVIQALTVLLVAACLSWPLAATSFAEETFYTINIGSLSATQDLEGTLAQYKAKGVDAFSRPQATTQGVRHDLYIGRFAERKDAEKQAQDLMSQGLITSYEVMLLGDPRTTGAQTPAPMAEAEAIPVELTENNPCLAALKGQERHLASYTDRRMAIKEAYGLQSSGYTAFIREEYPWYRVYVVPIGMKIGDSDGDGVCDNVDRCPNTPPGVVVDEFGCWIAALDTYFDFDKSVVKPQYHDRIKRAAEIINENPKLKVEVAGNTCVIGSDNYNLGLGFRRANAVRNLLVKFGVGPARLTVNSYGEKRPKMNNATAGGRSTNRRVELHITE